MNMEFIEWEDSSFGDGLGWQSVKHWLKSVNVMTCYSSGFVVKEDKTSLVLCSHLAGKEKIMDEDNFDIQGAMRIPLSAIRKRVVLMELKNNNNNVTRYGRLNEESDERSGVGSEGGSLRNQLDGRGLGRIDPTRDEGNGVQAIRELRGRD